MNRKLPPFPAVRAFEAAARHLSFRQAAEELHVTQSAISHQVKALERFLGQPLFCRENGGVALTDVGRSYLPAIGEALDRIASCTENVLERDASGTLEIVTTPAFASRWLLSRLGNFRESYPRLDVRLSTTVHGVDFARDCVDVAVWYGKGDEPGMRTDMVLRSDLYPVCNPKLLHGAAGLKVVRDLAHQTLLHSDQGETWSRWLQAAGVAGIDTSRGIRFDDCNLMIKAAIECQGVALAFSTLVADDLDRGRLVCPFDLSLKPASWYYVLSPAGWADRPKISAFRNWILDMARLAEVPAAAE